MDNVGVLIMFALLGTFICAKARVPGGAVAFSLLALVLFISTPAGSGLPGAVAGLLDTVDQSTTPVLKKSETPGGAR
ncbi:hypothetical protein [Pseudonocardia sp.]|uniref:hypothetical protein n=1 Tax=Pseudonocardia sp. TaxID=60912 RepID=UPI00263561E7|nr:hypothetical protein [Pseudonocardia sp.]